MPALIAFAGFVLAFTLAAGALPAAGFWWDLLAALGLCSATVVAFLGWDSESPAAQPRLRLHRNLGFVAAGLATGHAFGYLIIDSTVLEYLMPAAPAYMLAGLVAWVVLIGITFTSAPGSRKRYYKGFPTFRRWHRGLFLILVVTAGWHILGTGFSLEAPWQQGLAAAVLCAVPVLAYWHRRRYGTLPLTPGPPHAAKADAGAVLSCLTLVVLSAAYATVKLLVCSGC